MKDIPDLLETLTRSINLLEAFVQTIPADQLDRRRRDDCWTVAEHLCHLAQVQPMLLERLERFRDKEHPEFIPFIPGEGEDVPARPEGMTLPEALAQFGRYRQKQVALMAGADEAVWQRIGSHPEYTHYSFHILARHILMHDHYHMYRMEELWLTQDAFFS